MRDLMLTETEYRFAFSGMRDLGLAEMEYRFVIFRYA